MTKNVNINGNIYHIAMEEELSKDETNACCYGKCNIPKEYYWYLIYKNKK